ncbi:MAG: hypothetical protein V4467_02695 [Patescibacteria group bacterium]
MKLNSTFVDSADQDFVSRHVAELAQGELEISPKRYVINASASRAHDILEGISIGNGYLEGPLVVAGTRYLIFTRQKQS